MNSRTRSILLTLTSFIIFFYVLSSYHLVVEFPISTDSSFVSPKDEFLQELELYPNYQETGFNFQPSNPAKLPDKTKVLRQLKALFPYDPTIPIPKTLWQMWKVGPEDDDFPEPFGEYRQTWIDATPEYEHILKTNAEADAMVAELYADIPDIIHAYNIMPQTILKCDLSRYLILFAYGGVYADIDTKLLKPIDVWFSSQEQYLDKDLNLGLVVGIEADRVDWKNKFTRRVQINTWTIMARKGHPMLAELINKIIEETLRREEVGLLEAMLGKNKFDNIINWTGPGLFTDTTYKYMNSILQADFDNYEVIVNYNFFIGVQLPVVIGDVMVLPEECMRPRNVSSTGEFIDPLAYVKHLGSGIWKNKGKKKPDASKDTAKTTEKTTEKKPEKKPETKSS
ncbi:Initiation-specific alpha-16-mannosyltransferase [Spathaspora sp. JA1]|nr:Initiation-specific alpha-16-mannosyltransferase [Spathaspora sp. JA1]